MANFNFHKLLGIPEYSIKVTAFDYLNLPFYIKVGVGSNYKDGLYGKRYNGFCDETLGNVNWFATATQTTPNDFTGYNGDGTPYLYHGVEEATVDFSMFSSSFSSGEQPDDGFDYYSWQWTGYFKAPYTDNFTFKVCSDDSGYLWIGNNAVSGFNADNANINHGGLHGGDCLSSNPISLVGGQYYPIRIQFGENEGGDFIKVSYSSSTETNVSNFQGKFFHKTKDDLLLKDGLYASTAGDSAYQIKRDFPSSTDGLYWIKNANINNGEAFQIYADMTTLGGGWTLILNNHSYVGWTFANAISANVLNPPSDPTTITDNYSIIAWADYIKKSPSNFDYMFDAESRGYNGAAYTALSAYSFIELPAGQPRGDALQNTNGWRKNISEITRFSRLANTLQDPLTGVWDYNQNGIEFRMPYWTNEDIGHALITTNGSDGGWWGTLVSNNWNPVAPWQGNYDQGNNIEAYPSAIWYWVR
jgi:hypothetical protein